MIWTKESPNHYTAKGRTGYWSVEKRVGVWMVFDPMEDRAVCSDLPSANDAKEMAEKLAAEWEADGALDSQRHAR